MFLISKRYIFLPLIMIAQVSFVYLQAGAPVLDTFVEKAVEPVQAPEIARLIEDERTQMRANLLKLLNIVKAERDAASAAGNREGARSGFWSGFKRGITPDMPSTFDSLAFGVLVTMTAFHQYDDEVDNPQNKNHKHLKLVLAASIF